MVKLVGAGYLVLLGVFALRSALRRQAPHDEHDVSEATHPWSQAFLTNVLNPKAALFFVAVIPQFVPANSGVADTALLAAVTVLFGALWWPMIAAVASRLSGLRQSPRMRRTLDAVTGIGLVVLGVRLARTPH